MDYEFTHKPSYTHLIVSLERGESVQAEPGAMVGHSSTVSMETESNSDGLLGSAKSMLGGESTFVNNFTAEEGPGQVTLAPPSPGDVMSYELQNETLYSTDGAFLAGTEDVEVDSEIGGVKSVIGEAGLTPLALRGTGTVFIDAYGGLETFELGRNESYVLDNEHLIAWDDSIDYTTRKVGGLKSTMLSGEGLVFEFTGPGTAWYQTRDIEALASFLNPYISTGDS